jgi:hypothetical protein
MHQRRRSNSAGSFLSPNFKAKRDSKTSPSSPDSHGKKVGRSRSSSWWRNSSPGTSPIREDLPLNTRIVLAGRDLSPMFSKSTPGTPGTPSSPFVLVPKAGLASRIVATNKDENDVVTVTIRPTHPSGQGGWLETCCVDLFGRAYGLQGKEQENHHTLYEEALVKSQCSRRAFLEVLYGHSYNHKLGDLRAQVPGYPEKNPVNKKNKHEREAQLEKLAVSMNTLSQKSQLRSSAPVFVPGQ